MPHWESLQRGQWEAVCRLAGVRFIDPRRPVEQVLHEIASSEVLVTEAMHGAIVADALRVPWVPVLPFHRSHHFKWHDWAESLGLRLQPFRLWPSSALEAHVARYQGDGGPFQWPGRPLRLALRVANRGFLWAAAARLQRAARAEPSLSPDAALTRVLDRLQTSAEQIRRDYAVRA
jgi:succinoglycan biosynthesis protein ExoV